MVLRCRVCRSANVAHFISVSSLVIDHQKTVADLICEVQDIGSLLSRYDTLHNLPRYVCNRCLSRLDSSYRMLNRCRAFNILPKCDIGKEIEYFHCRFCTVKKRDELSSLDTVSRSAGVTITEMIATLAKIEIEDNDRLPPYACGECVQSLEVSYEFRREARASAEYFKVNVLYAWERMEYQRDCPDQLVVELFTEAIVASDGNIYCSVCKHGVPYEAVEEQCHGCLLEYRNVADIVAALNLCEKEGEDSRVIDDDCPEDKFKSEEDSNDANVVQSPRVDPESPTGYEVWMKENLEDNSRSDNIHEENDEGQAKSQEMPSESMTASTAACSRKSITSDKLNPLTCKPLNEMEEVVEFLCCVENCKRVGTLGQLQLHSETAHHHYAAEILDADEYLFCQYCNKSFPDELSLQSHRKQHTVKYRCLVPDCLFITHSRPHAVLHCSRKPHHAPLRAGKQYVKGRTNLGLYFTVTGKYDETTDILTRTGERCCICHEMFETIEQLHEHRVNKHPLKEEEITAFRCELCNRSFASESRLAYHRSYVTIRKHYYCKPCKYFIWSRIHLTTHKANEHPEAKCGNELYDTLPLEKLPCCGCRKVFASEEELLEHRSTVHYDAEIASEPEVEKTGVKCNFCNKYVKERLLQTHLSVYDRKHLFRCKVEQCVFQTTSLIAIKKHVSKNTHEGPKKTIVLRVRDPTEYFCCIRMCDVTFTSYDDLIQHGEKEHSDVRFRQNASHKDLLFQCLVCSKRFDSSVKLTNHKNGRRTYKCKFCLESMDREIYMGHVEKCPEKDAPKTCKICSKELMGKRKLERHMRATHGEKLKEVCTICGKMFWKSSFQDHLARHANDRRFKCEQCPLAFNSVYVLERHTTVHTNEKKYVCRLGCDNRYKQPCDRYRHENLVHKGLRPFVCKVCPKSYGRERDLRLHERVHTGQKLYRCEHCSTGFDKLSDFRQHQEELHGSD